MPSPTELHKVLTEFIADQIRHWLQSFPNPSLLPCKVRGEAYISVLKPDTRQIVHNGVPDITLSKLGDDDYDHLAMVEIACSQTQKNLDKVLNFWAKVKSLKALIGVKVDEFGPRIIPDGMSAADVPDKATWTEHPGGEFFSDNLRWSGPHRITIQVWIAGERRISAVCVFTIFLVNLY